MDATQDVEHSFCGGFLYDAARRIDVLSSLLGAGLLYGYGVWRAIYFYVEPTFPGGEAVFLAGAAPFVYGTLYSASLVYHLTIRNARLSSITLEIDVGMILASLSWTTVVLVFAASSLPNGSSPSTLRFADWGDTILIVGLAWVVFGVQRSCVDPNQSFRKSSTDTVNGSKEQPLDQTHKHYYEDVWHTLRHTLLFLLCVAWLLQINLLTAGLRDRPGMRAPPVAVVQGVATLLFLVAAFVNTTSLAARCAPSTPEAFAHTTWHVLGLCAAFVSQLNVDFLLLPWQLDGKHVVPGSVDAVHVGE